MRDQRTVERLLAATGAVLLVAQLAVVTSQRGADEPPETVAIEEAAPSPEPTTSGAASRRPTGETPEEPAGREVPEDTGEAAASGDPAAGEVVVLDPGEPADGAAPAPTVERPPAGPSAGAQADVGQPAPPPDPGGRGFAGDFPAQEAATQDPRDPATTRWAVLIGINDHHGPTRDNVGSRQDAEDLHRHLVDLGWRQDHIVLLTDHGATRERIEQAIAWLARKTDDRSVAVFHYSGHTKQWPGRDVDGDGEVPDEALWPADNRHLTDGELTARLGEVRAGRLWIDIGACEAAGYADPGMLREGRLLTFSSREEEKSYEDPSVSNSVWGYYLVERGLRNRSGDADGDGDVTVQEAFHYAAPQAARRTADASHGPQHPVMHDRAGPFSLAIPAPPPDERPSDADGDGSDDAPRDRPSDDHDRDCGLLICPSASRSGVAAG